MESPLLQLQMDALLSETTLQATEESAMGDILQQLKQILLQLPAKQVAPDLAGAYLKAFGMSGMGSFAFQPPESVTTTGSYATHCISKPDAVADVAVTIPKSCFYSKDFLDCKYHGKRILWLAVIAAHLKKSALFKEQEWVLLNGDARKPALVLKPTFEAGTDCNLTIRLIPTISMDTFPLAKLSPERGNLRHPTVVAGSATAASAPATAVAAGGNKEPKGRKRKQPERDSVVPVSNSQAIEISARNRSPTPHYNSSIVADMMVSQHEQAVQTAFQAVPRLSEAVVLLKVWMRKHCLSGHSDGFNGFLMTLFAAHLVRQKRLNPAMSHTQLLRTILHALADPRTFPQGIFMQWEEGQTPGQASGGQSTVAPSQQAMRKAFDVVFVDNSGWCNLAAHVCKSALQQLQGCAKRSVMLLDQASAGQHTFETLFLSSQSPVTMYDYLFHVQLPQPASSGQLQVHDAQSWQQADKRVESIVKQALGPRATLVHAHRRQPHVATPKKGGVAAPQGPILVGVQADPTAAMQLRDIGPPADDVQAAAKFRQFWGDKAELRRFQDGNIAEAVVWECGPAERHTVVDQIAQYALQRHLPAGSSVVSQAGCLDSVLQSKHAEANAQILASRQLDAAVDRLSKQIRGLTNLTLKVVSTQPLSALSRHTAPFYPLPHPLAGAGGAAGVGRVPRCLEPAELLLQLEGSGKWADVPEAFKKMKAALGVQLAQALESSFGLDAEASEDYVDVLTDGFAIRLFLFSNRDEVMAARADKESSQPSVSRVLSQRAQHHGVVTGVGGQNPSFSMAARLSVRWVAAHMMAGCHVPVEAVELIVAAAFLPTSAVQPPPGSPVAGFARFLHLLSTHPWKDRPLVLDPSQELSASQFKAMHTQFDASKAEGHARDFTVCTPTDLRGLAWGQAGMSHALRQRLVKLASKSLQVLQNQLEHQQTGADPSSIFVTPLEDFDALFILRPEGLPYPDRAAPGSALPGGHANNGDGDDLGSDDDGLLSHKKAVARLHSIPQGILQKKNPMKLRKELLIGFDPVRLFMQHIQQQCEGVATILVDMFGGHAIGVKWDAKALEARPLDVQHASLLEPVKLQNTGCVLKCMLSIPVLLSDIKASGAGLISHVVVQSSSA